MQNPEQFVNQALENSGYTDNEIQMATFRGTNTNQNEQIFEITFINSDGECDHGNVYITFDTETNSFKGEF